jgi:hypothetical protein
MAEKLLTPQEAKELAKEYMKIPDETIREINKLIVDAVAADLKVATFYRSTTMNTAQWRAITLMIRGYYDVKCNSCQRDGEWLTIHLPS